MTKQEVIDLLPRLKQMTASERTREFLPLWKNREISSEQYVFLTTLKTKPLVERDVSYAPDPVVTVSGDTTHPNPITGTSQKAKILSLLSDYKWHNSTEILNRVYGPGVSFGAIPSRISELRQDGYFISENKRDHGTIYKWRMYKTKEELDADNV